MEDGLGVGRHPQGVFYSRPWQSTLLTVHPIPMEGCTTNGGFQGPGSTQQEADLRLAEVSFLAPGVA